MSMSHYYHTTDTLTDNRQNTTKLIEDFKNNEIGDSINDDININESLNKSNNNKVPEKKKSYDDINLFDTPQELKKDDKEAMTILIYL